MTGPRTAVLVGVMEDNYRRTLVALLEELGLETRDATEPGTRTPSLVLATVPFDHVERVLKVATWVAEGCPVLALLPVADDDLIRRAAASGATASYVLGVSTDTLRSTIIRLLGERGPVARGT